MKTIDINSIIDNKKIYFSVKIKLYENFLNLLYENDMSFLTEKKIDFNNIPIILHGKGNSTNLLDYISNNQGNNKLIINFFKYFISYIKLRYSDNVDVKLVFLNDSECKMDWQNVNVLIDKRVIITTTTTTTGS